MYIFFLLWKSMRPETGLVTDILLNIRKLAEWIWKW